MHTRPTALLGPLEWSVSREIELDNNVWLAAWRIVVSRVRRMNEVNARRARLQLGLVTVFERVYHLGL